MSIGERIIELRKASGISQYELSKALNISRQAVSKWENDQSSPDATNLIRLADLLDTDIEYLTTGRRSYGRRPPVVLTTTQVVEKIIEKPVVQVVEKIVEKPIIQYVETPVVEYRDKPVVKKIYRIKTVRNPIEMAILGIVCFLAGLFFGYFL